MLVLDFEIPGRWNRRGVVDVELRVPRARASTSWPPTGASACRACAAPCAAVEQRDDPIEDVDGDISVATSNAKVSTLCTCGRLRARSSNGKIEVEEHRGSVDASTSNGMIDAISTSSAPRA